LYPNDTDVCHACQNRNPHNVRRYAPDQVVGDRTWYGTSDHIDVSEFDRSHAGDFMARNELVAIKYYLEMVMDFYARQHICYSAYMPWQFRLSVRLSVRHTGGSVNKKPS